MPWWRGKVSWGCLPKIINDSAINHLEDAFSILRWTLLLVKVFKVMNDCFSVFVLIVKSNCLE